jgi:hypothetical protein
LTRLSEVCFSGLLDRRVIVSRVRTSLFSVRRSEAAGAVPVVCFLGCAVAEARRSFSPIFEEGTRGRAPAVVEVDAFRSAGDGSFEGWGWREDMAIVWKFHRSAVCWWGAI